jgi:hypothetical protein
MKLYAVTHIIQHGPMTGTRTLTFANQGRNHYRTREDAERSLAQYRPGLEMSIGKAADTLEVREVECYDHGDAKGIYFD